MGLKIFFHSTHDAISIHQMGKDKAGKYLRILAISHTPCQQLLMAPNDKMNLILYCWSKSVSHVGSTLMCIYVLCNYDTSKRYTLSQVGHHDTVSNKFTTIQPI